MLQEQTKNVNILEFRDYFWNPPKCIQISTNMPSIGLVICKLGFEFNQFWERKIIMRQAWADDTSKIAQNVNILEFRDYFWNHHGEFFQICPKPRIGLVLWNRLWNVEKTTNLLHGETNTWMQSVSRVRHPDDLCRHVSSQYLTIIIPTHKCYLRNEMRWWLNWCCFMKTC